MNHNVLAKGSWGSNVSWELFLGTERPTLHLVTSVFCVVILSDERFILTRNRRGWEIPGGHIEQGETLEEALFRECFEEGGFYPTNPQQFAYRKIKSTEPIPQQRPDKYYHHPVSYQYYYWATTDRQLIEPAGDDVLESSVFTLEQIRHNLIHDGIIIEAGYRAYLHSRTM